MTHAEQASQSVRAGGAPTPEPVQPVPGPGPMQPEPGEPSIPGWEPEREPWQDPGSPVRKINLPPDRPGEGVPVEPPTEPLPS